MEESLFSEIYHKFFKFFILKNYNASIKIKFIIEKDIFN